MLVPGLVGDEIFSVSGFKKPMQGGERLVITSSCPWHARDIQRVLFCNVHSKLKHSKPTVGYGCFLYTQSRQQAEHMPPRNIKEEHLYV
jgi:hypothetical protein